MGAERESKISTRVLLDFLAALVAFFGVAVFLGITADEVSRINTASQVLETGRLDFFWPPLSYLIISMNPLSGHGYIWVRFLNILAAAPIFFEMSRLLETKGARAIFYICLPYFALVVGTASQQGLMIALLGYLVIRPFWPFWAKGLLMGLSYGVNPSLIVILPTAYLALILTGKARASDLFAAILGYILVFPFVAIAYWQTGRFLPSLSTNGPYNLFLGNNPNPLSVRGIGDLQNAWGQLGLAGRPSYMGAVAAYLAQEPTEFLLKIGEKLILFFSPMDIMRSGLGGRATGLFFGYAAVIEVLIYGNFWKTFGRRGMTRVMWTALWIMGVAWLIYAAFFVKIRFRVPFDFLLLLAAFFSNSVPLASPRPASGKISH